MDKSTNKIIDWVSINGTSLYILIMLVVFPVFNTNKFFNLDDDKTNFFLVATITYACFMLLAVVKAILNWLKQDNLFLPPFKFTPATFALLLLLAVILSTIFSLNIRKSLFGVVSRNVSSLCLLLGIMVFFAVRKYGVFHKLILWGWMAGSAIIYIIGIFCACGINFFHLQDGIIPSEIALFLTPLSNTNCNTCYVCLALPPIIVLYMTCKDRFSQILYGIYIYVAILFIYFIKTDAAILTLIFGMILLGYFALESSDWAERYVQIAGIYFGAKLTIKILLFFFEKKMLYFHGTSLFLLTGKILILDLLCCLLLIVIWRWRGGLLREKLAGIRKHLLIAAFAIALLTILCILYANIMSGRLTKDSLLQRLVITDMTFNERGYMWRKTVRALLDAPLGRKLVGCGLNCHVDFLGENSYFPDGKIFYEPHCEILQITLNIGLIGLVGYFGLLISTLVNAYKNWKKSEPQIITAFTLSLFLVQCLTNAFAIYHLPLLFIFLGFANGKGFKVPEKSDRPGFGLKSRQN
ncbi:MAG: hypothetical protein HFG88_05190 [Dorea sp.]|nr:hypothetical protein [Dorea sp.]